MTRLTIDRAKFFHENNVSIGCETGINKPFISSFQFSSILLTSSISVDRIFRRDADAAFPLPNAKSLAGSFRMMPKLFRAMTANMNMHSENFACGDRPR